MCRSDSGFSLVSVTVLSATALLFLAGTAAAIIPIFKWVGTDSSDTRLAVAAESGADYALDLLNDMGERASVDPGASPWKSIPVPAGLQQLLVPGGTVSVVVAKLDPPADAYIPSEQQSYGMTYKWGSIFANKNFWRLITCSATSGSMTKTVQVACCPVISGPTMNSLANSSVTPTNSFFPNSSLFGIDQVWLGEGSSTETFENVANQYTGASHKLGANVSSYGKIKLSNASVGGIVDVKFDGGSSHGSAQAEGISTQVGQFLVLNGGSQSGFSDTSASNPNVFNDSNANVLPNSAGSDLDALVEGNTGLPNYSSNPSLPPAYSAPSGAINSGAVTLSSGAVVSAGDYAVSKLTIKPGVSFNSSDSAPIRYFVEGNATDAVNISGDVNLTGQSPQFQIWYNGSGNITINGPSGSLSPINFRGTIYAPNANVIFPGGTPVVFHGAIVAKTISGGIKPTTGEPEQGAKKLTMVYDYGLGTAHTASPGTSLGSLSYSYTQFTKNPVLNSSLKWQAVSVHSPNRTD